MVLLEVLKVNSTLVLDGVGLTCIKIVEPLKSIGVVSANKANVCAHVSLRQIFTLYCAGLKSALVLLLQLIF
jgi:hypothetical protein